MLGSDAGVLFGKRICEDGSECWQLPGGKMQLNESPLEAAARELFEETGLQASSLKLVAVTDNRLSDNSQTITLCFEGQCINPEGLSNREPEKCSEWHWMPWSNLPGQLFLPLRVLRNTAYQPFYPLDSPIHVSF